MRAELCGTGDFNGERGDDAAQLPLAITVVIVTLWTHVLETNAVFRGVHIGIDLLQFSIL